MEADIIAASRMTIHRNLSCLRPVFCFLELIVIHPLPLPHRVRFQLLLHLAEG